MIVKEIASCPLKELKATFDEVVQTKDFSAAATCGVEVLSQERRSALIEKFEQAGLRLAPSEIEYAVRIIAHRIINRT